MTKITQISAAALLAVFASTAFVSTAEAGSKKVWCKETSSKLFRTACEEHKFRRQYTRFKSPTNQGKPVQNFRSRSDAELGVRGLNGGSDGAGSGGANGGGKR